MRVRTPSGGVSSRRTTGSDPTVRRSGTVDGMSARRATPSVDIEVGGRDVRVSNPDRVYFPARGETKLDLVRYYLAVGDGIVNALRERPCMLHRFPARV